MKKPAAVILIILVGISVFAEFSGVLFGPDSFKIDILKKKHMTTVSKKDLPADLKVDYAFTDAKKTYQLRYSTFKQNDKNVTDEDLTLSFGVFALTYILNMYGIGDIDLSGIQRFDDADVQADFNGDFGTTAYIANPNPAYCKGYKYMLVNFYCKKGQGVVIQTLLFNDVSFFGEEYIIEVFNSFKFKN